LISLHLSCTLSLYYSVRGVLPAPLPAWAVAPLIIALNRSSYDEWSMATPNSE
jgi:hypothetical protein